MGYQHTATHCNTLQHTATHCNTLQHTSYVGHISHGTPLLCVVDITYWMIHMNYDICVLQCVAVYCSVLQLHIKLMIHMNYDI